MGFFGLKKKRQKQRQLSDLSSVATPETNRYSVPDKVKEVIEEQPKPIEDNSKIVEAQPSSAIEAKPSTTQSTPETKTSFVVEMKSSNNIEMKPSSASNVEPVDLNSNRTSSSRISKVASRISSRVSSRGSRQSSVKHSSYEPLATASFSVPSVGVNESRDETVGMSNRKSSSGSRASNKSSVQREITNSKSSHSAHGVAQETAEEKNDTVSVAPSINDAASNASERSSTSKKSKTTFMGLFSGKQEEKKEEEPERPPDEDDDKQDDDDDKQDDDDDKQDDDEVEFEVDEEKQEELVSDKEVNYDISPTLLYKFIEYKDWGEALERCKVAPDEAKTWVFRYDEHDNDEIYYGQKKEQSIRWRMLPIHVAIIFNAPMEVVIAILDANPDGIKSSDDRKMLPLHLCARNLTDPKLAEYLIKREPETLNFTDYKGRNPLNILTEYRNKIAEKDDEKSMLELKQRNAIINLMMKRMGISDANDDDESAIESDDDDKENDAQNDENQSLSRKKSAKVGRSQSLQKKSSSRSKESSISEDKAFKIIPQEERKLNYLKRDKKKLTREVDYDTTPTVLIKLIERKMWEQAITRCVENPEEASTWMSRLQEVNDKVEGKKEIRWKILPIHSAIVLHAPVEVIEALVNAYPQGLRKGDDRKMLPLHMAFRLGASPETTAVLVDAYPDAIKKKDSKGHTPLHILKAYRRKYQKERSKGSKSNSDMDKNRKHLIKFYLGSRRYGSDDDATLAPYDSGSDSDDDSDYSDETAWDDDYYDDDEDDYDRLFNRNMFTDFGRLTVEGISAVPGMLRDTLSCNTRY